MRAAGEGQGQALGPLELASDRDRRRRSLPQRPAGRHLREAGAGPALARLQGCPVAPQGSLGTDLQVNRLASNQDRTQALDAGTVHIVLSRECRSHCPPLLQ